MAFAVLTVLQSLHETGDGNNHPSLLYGLCGDLADLFKEVYTSDSISNQPVLVQTGCSKHIQKSSKGFIFFNCSDNWLFTHL